MILYPEFANRSPSFGIFHCLLEGGYILDLGVDQNTEVIYECMPPLSPDSHTDL